MAVTDRPFYEPITARDAWFGRRGIKIPLRDPLAPRRIADALDKVTAGQSPADPAALAARR